MSAYPLAAHEVTRIDSKRFAAEPAPVTAFQSLDATPTEEYTEEYIDRLGEWLAQPPVQPNLEDAQTEAYAEGRKDEHAESLKRDAIEDAIRTLPMTKENLVWLLKEADVLANQAGLNWLDNVHDVRHFTLEALCAAEGCQLLRAGE